MKLHHTDESTCPECENKLRSAHPTLVAWFHRLKRRYTNVHVCWAWRGPEDQEIEFKARRSSKLFPHSKHNAMQDNKPCSLALDIFQIDEDGVARFSRPFYTKVDAENRASREPIRWGGDWNGNGVSAERGEYDFDHFELSGVCIDC